jgi:hypothetical protein
MHMRWAGATVSSAFGFVDHMLNSHADSDKTLMLSCFAMSARSADIPCLCFGSTRSYIAAFSTLPGTCSSYPLSSIDALREEVMPSALFHDHIMLWFLLSQTCCVAVYAKLGQAQLAAKLLGRASAAAVDTLFIPARLGYGIMLLLTVVEVFACSRKPGAFCTVLNLLLRHTHVFLLGYLSSWLCWLSWLV